jgi:hypothetical protein
MTNYLALSAGGLNYVVAYDLPTISDVVATQDTTSADITWTTTSGASSEVEFGLTNAYGTTLGDATESVTSHSVTLYWLAPETLYHYRVKSVAGGIPKYSADATFTTDACGCRGLTTRAPAGGETVISSLPYEITSSGYYILSGNLASNTSGIAIKANNVTLDLNGYTITYGNGVALTRVRTYSSNRPLDAGETANYGHIGIVSAGAELTPSYCTDFSWEVNAAYTNVVIKNGTVTSGSGSGLAFSPGVLLASCDGSVYDLVINQSTDDGGGIWGTLDTVDIHHCTVNCTDDFVTDRSAWMGAIRWGHEVHHNKITGGAQCGIVGGTTTHHNLIAHNGYATNPYGHLMYWTSPGRSSTHNRIISTHGRGMDATEYTHGASEVAYNYVDVTDPIGQNPDQQAYVHGIKFDLTNDETNGASDVWFHHNYVKATASNGVIGTALNVDMVAGKNNLIENNVFVAVKSAGQQAAAFFCYGGDGTGSLIRNNSFASDESVVRIASAANYELTDCTFELVSGGSNFFSASAFYDLSHNSSLLKFNNATLVNTTADDYAMPGNVDYAGDIVYEVSGVLRVSYDYPSGTITETPL